MNYLPLVITFAPKFFWGLIFISAILRHLFRNRPLAASRLFKVLNYKLLIIVSVGFRVLNAGFLTLVQYSAWSKDAIGRFLLDSPLDKALDNHFFFKHFGYFTFYAYGRFWLNVLIAVVAAFAFYLFLKFLKKYRERFFEEGETELGFLTALIVGWPGFVIFVPLVFVSVVIFSIFRGIAFKRIYTTLGWPLLLAAFLALIWGDKLINLFCLGILRI